MDRLLPLAVMILPLSFLTIGGANTVLPELHKQMVDGYGWLTAEEFAQLFAIAQAAPGPNILVASLLGWRAAGWAGLIVATLAMVGPTALLAYALTHARARFARADWLRRVQAGLVPITVGLILATGTIMARAAASDLALLGITLGVALWVLLREINPLWLLAGAGLLGLLLAGVK